MNISNLDRFAGGLPLPGMSMVSNGVALGEEQGCYILEQAVVDEKRPGLSWVVEWLTSR